MIETIIPSVIVGMLSAGATAVVSFYVLKQKVVGMEALFEEKIKSAVKDSNSAITAVTQRVDAHSDTLKRVIYKDVCDACKERQMDRHSEILRRIENLEKAMGEVNATVKQCFAELVDALRADKMRMEPGA